MVAIANELLAEGAAMKRTAELLYAWGDETRSRADELGLPASSGIARMIEQQRVFDSKRRGRRQTKRRSAAADEEKPMAGVVRRCVCGMLLKGESCPRCDGFPAEPHTVHGTPTVSFKPQTMTQISSRSLDIEAIVRAAPGWIQKPLKRKFVHLQRDHKAAQDLRISKRAYREQLEAAIEYVGERLST